MNKFRTNYKKVTSLLLVIIMLFSCISFTYPSAFAAGTEYTKDGYTYTVSGSTAKIVSYTTSSSGKVTIPSKLNGYTVTTIGEEAFYACTTLTEIIIPNTVTKIEDYAFSFCISLKTCRIPSSVKSIGKDIFCFNDDVVVECEEGSVAWQYAKDNGLKTSSSELENTKDFDVSLYFNGTGNVSEIDGKTSLDGVFSTSYLKNWGNYSKGLANICIGLSAAAYSEARLKETLKSLGCENENIKTYYGYADGDKVDGTRYGFGVRNVVFDGEKKLLFFVGISGTNATEWYGNFNIGRGEEAQSFNKAKNKVVVSFADFYNNNCGKFEKDDIYIIVTGHSRGAAISNLFAKYLINDTSLCNYKNVYAYTFATPNVTTKKNVNDAKYNNIFNIVNSEDFVTYAPIPQWGFNKYGKTFVAPDSATVSKKTWKSYLKDMEKVFKDLTGGAKYKECNTGSKATIKLTKNIYDLAQNTSAYYDNTYKIWWMNGLKYEEGYYSLYDYFNWIADIVAGDAGGLFSGAVGMVKRSLQSAFKSISTFFIDGAKVGDLEIWHAHCVETYMSWVKTLDASDWTKYTKYNKTVVKCPVDVEVYNEDGELMAVICDDKLEEGVDADLLVEVEGSAKIFYLPCDEKYTFKIKGTDKGTMDIVSETGDIRTMESTSKTLYRDVTITDGASFEASIEGSDISLYDEDHRKIKPTKIVDTTVSVTSNVEGDGEIFGTGTYNFGDSVELIAVNNEGYVFEGWYSDEKFISDDSTIAFIAEEDVNYTCKFVEAQLSMNESDIQMKTGESYQLSIVLNPIKQKVEYTSSNEAIVQVSEDGLIFAKQKGEAIITVTSESGHSDSCNVKVFDDNCSCNCHKSGIANFFFKLILFFQKLFKSNQVCKCGMAHY